MKFAWGENRGEVGGALREQAVGCKGGSSERVRVGGRVRVAIAKSFCGREHSHN